MDDLSPWDGTTVGMKVLLDGMDTPAPPGEWVKPGTVLTFRAPRGSGLAPDVECQGYSVEVNGTRWRGVLQKVTRTIYAELEFEIRLTEMYPST